MTTMRLEDMNDMIRTSLKEYEHFAIYDKTNEIYIATFDDPETAINIANTIHPFNCDVLYVEAFNSPYNEGGSLPFYLRDIPNEYCKADTRIAVFEVYVEARAEWTCDLVDQTPFEDILFKKMKEYDNRGLTGEEFTEYLYHEYSFDHESAVALIENIIKYAKMHYDDNESAVYTVKSLLEGIGINDEDMDKLQIIK